MALTSVLYSETNTFNPTNIVEYYKQCVLNKEYHYNSVGGENIVGYGASINTTTLKLAVEELIKQGYNVEYRFMSCAHGSFYGIVEL
jgi:hypothetical protein